jgi:hypothetical protein
MTLVGFSNAFKEKFTITRRGLQTKTYLVHLTL